MPEEHLFKKSESWRSPRHWHLMNFLGGSFNAGGFLACRRFVSHVTGFSTLFGVESATERWDTAVGILTVPMYFVLGAMLSAYLIDRPLNQGKKAHYGWVMALITFFLISCGLLGHLKVFGIFGTLKLK